jgi:predicted PurR-regulated permease PerM
MESKTQPDERKHGPRWSATTKVVVASVLIVLSGLFFYLFRVALVPLLIAMIMAFIFYPVAHRVSKLTRLSHSIATLLVYMVLVALIVPVILLLSPQVVNQILLVQSELIDLIQYLNTVSVDTIVFMNYTIVIGDVVQQVTADLTRLITSTAARTIAFVAGAARAGFIGVFSLVIGFYLTRDAEKFVAWVLSLAPPKYRKDFRHVFVEINNVWAAFFRGQLMLCFIVALILGIASAALGLPQPILLGIWGGILELFPSIGNTIWGATAVTLAAIFGSTYIPLPPVAFALLVFAVYFAFIQLDTNFLIPNIIGVYIQLHPAVVILGIIIGMEIGGILGLAIAAPTIASLRVIGRYVYAMLFDLDPFPARPAKKTRNRNKETELTPTKDTQRYVEEPE